MLVGTLDSVDDTSPVGHRQLFTKAYGAGYAMNFVL